MSYGSSSKTNGSDTITIPAGSAGDLLVVYGIDVTTPPAGWATHKWMRTNAGLPVRRWQKIRAAEVTGNTLAWTGATDFPVLFMFNLVGVADTSATAQDQQVNSAVIAPTVTATAPGGTLVMFAWSPDQALSGTPSGMTKRQDNTDSQVWTSEVSAGATGTRSLTAAGSATWCTSLDFFANATTGGGSRIKVQERTRGFPPGAPIPGIPRLGFGIFATTSPAPSVTYQSTGTGALSPFGVSAAGLVTFIGLGSASVSPFATTSTAVETFTGTATAALTSFACSGAGTEAFTSSGSVAVSPFASAGSAATGTVFTSTGSAALSPFAVTAAGLETFTSTGTAAVRSFACSGSGLETCTATGSAALQSFASVGSAALGSAITGSATAAVARFAAVAAGLEAFTGAGSVGVRSFTGTGAANLAFVGSGAAALPPFGATAAGVLGSFIGVGTVAATPFGVVAVGQLGVAFMHPADGDQRWIARYTAIPRVALWRAWR